MYWLCFGLWKSNSFKYYLKGSVIPFITIGDVKTHLQNSESIASNNPEKFTQTIQALKALETNALKLKKTLNMIEIAKQTIFHELMKRQAQI